MNMLTADFWFTKLFVHFIISIIASVSIISISIISIRPFQKKFVEKHLLLVLICVLCFIIDQ